MNPSESEPPTDADGDAVHPFAPAGWVDPAPSYEWMRRSKPLFVDPYTEMVLLTRHADVSALLRSADVSAALAQQRRTRAPLPTTMLNTDPPEHDRLRAPVSRLLAPAAISTLANDLRTQTMALLVRLCENTRIEVMSELARPFATLVLCTLLEVPEAARGRFSRLSRAASLALDPLATPEQAAVGDRGASQLTALLRTHVTDGGNSFSGPLGRFLADDRLTAEEALRTLVLCVVGGYEPLVALAGTSVLWMARQPAAFRAIAERPSLAQNAVDEVLRLDSPIPFVSRQSTGPTRLPSGEVPAGTSTLGLLGAANRDDAVFAAPGELQLDRPPGDHLAFGAGTHFCPGAALVRQSTALLLEQLARRVKRIRLVEPQEAPAWRASLVPRALTALHVLLDPAENASSRTQ